MGRFDFIISVILIAIVTSLVAHDGAYQENDETTAYEERNTVNIAFEDSLVDWKVERFDNIIKSPRDTRLYRGLKLGNQLSVLLISDPETDKAAASMTVGVGSMHDYEDVQGLAHFLEHMLFMGSKKYPAENHFTKFIQEHAGTENGSTGEDRQNYYWDIAFENLDEILDIFAQFFLEPLMDPSCAEREVNAVNSEFSMNQTKDSWRISHLQCSLSKPGHTHGHFGIGNLKSLSTDPKEKGINVLEKLSELYSTRYSSNLMYLAVLGKETLDELEDMVVPRFEIVKNKKLQRSVHTEHPWGPEQLKRRIHILTVADIRLLTLRFPMPEFKQHYKAMPLSYIRTLIGHEGPGSIFAELKRRNWCESLTDGISSIPGFSFLYIDINLTEDAMDHIDDVIKIVFQYIYMLKNKMQEEPQKWIFDEIKQIRETKFEYAPKSLPIDFVVSASSSLMDYPMEEVLSYGLLIDQWDPSLIGYFLDFLRPDNMNVLISSKSFEEIEGKTQTEPWYGIKYNVEKMSDDFIEKTWKVTEVYDKLHLPPRNEFIAANFQIYQLGATESKMPRIIHESSYSQFWFKQDEIFKLPRMNIRFNIYSPYACLNHQNEGLNSIFVSLFEEKYTTYGYAASLAGLYWDVSTIRCGLEVDLFGYHEKLPVLLQNLLSEMINYMPEEKKFETQKEAEIRWLRNFVTRQPYDHGSFYISHLLHYSVFAKQEFLNAIRSLGIYDMYKFAKKHFSRVFIQGLIYGNCDEQLAMQVVNIVENAFKSASIVLSQEVAFVRGLEMEDESNFTYTTAHKHSTSSGYSALFQIGPDNPLINIVLPGLFAQVVNEKCFQVLRAEEQLGYTVWCGLKRSASVMSFTVTVQSEKHPAFVDSRVEAFLEALHKTLNDMTDDDVETHKTSLINIYMEKIVDQADKSEYYWNEITDRRYLFDKNEQMSELVKPLRKKDILDFYEKYIRESSTKRRKLAIYVVSEVTNPKWPDDVHLGHTKIEDPLDFKNGSGWFPLGPPAVEVSPIGAKV